LAANRIFRSRQREWNHLAAVVALEGLLYVDSGERTHRRLGHVFDG
jgi:hypothetical protein